jgi:hypothetical protein
MLEGLCAVAGDMETAIMSNVIAVLHLIWAYLT